MAARRTGSPVRYRPRATEPAVRLREPATATAAAVDERLRRLIDQLGNNGLAGLLDVNPSQPSRWRSGEERLGAESRRRLLDLDYVIGRLLEILPPRQAEIWLTSFNSHLGARPVDVLHLRGAGPVIQAIDAEDQGAYA